MENILMLIMGWELFTKFRKNMKFQRSIFKKPFNFKKITIRHILIMDYCYINKNYIN